MRTTPAGAFSSETARRLAIFFAAAGPSQCTAALPTRWHLESSGPPAISTVTIIESPDGNSTVMEEVSCPERIFPSQRCHLYLSAHAGSSGETSAIQVAVSPDLSTRLGPFTSMVGHSTAGRSCAAKAPDEPTISAT